MPAEEIPVPLFGGFGEPEFRGTCSQCNQEVGAGMCPDHPQAPIHRNDRFPIRLRVLNALLQPFLFLEADAYLNQRPNPAGGGIALPPSHQEIVEFLCRNASRTPDNIARRWQECSNEQPRLVPNVDFVTRKLIEPMQQAQASFMLGNWYSVIVLCGVLCETLTEWIARIAAPHLTINGLALTDELQQSLFGTTLAGATQDRRLQILSSLNAIDAAGFGLLNRVRELRNDYVHGSVNFDPNQLTQRNHAVECLRNTGHVFSRVMVQPGPNGNVQLHPWVEQYLIGIGALAAAQA